MVGLYDWKVQYDGVRCRWRTFAVTNIRAIHGSRLIVDNPELNLNTNYSILLYKSLKDATKNLNGI